MAALPVTMVLGCSGAGTSSKGNGSDVGAPPGKTDVDASLPPATQKPPAMDVCSIVGHECVDFLHVFDQGGGFFNPSYFIGPVAATETATYVVGSVAGDYAIDGAPSRSVGNSGLILRFGRDGSIAHKLLGNPARRGSFNQLDDTTVAADGNLVVAGSVASPTVDGADVYVASL